MGVKFLLDKIFPYSSNTEYSLLNSLNRFTMRFTRSITFWVRAWVGTLDSNSSSKLLSWMSMPYRCSERFTSSSISTVTALPKTMASA